MLNKSICLIGGGLAIGGQERALVFLANNLAQNSYRVVILCLFKTPIEFDLHPNITVIFPDLEREGQNRFIYALKLIPYIRQNIRDQKIYSMICYGDWFNSYTLIATLGLPIKKVITNRMGPNLNLGRVIESLNKLFYRFADAMIVQTLRAKEIISKKYKIKKIFVIPNPVEPFGYERSKLTQSIITVGRLSREKGHDTLIRAFSMLKQNGWQLHIIGDGKERENLDNLVKSLQIEKSVIFHGKLKNFKSLLKSSDIFVLPSLYEGFPNALLEAMGSGLCCVASDCVAGPSELIQDGYSGRLFEPLNHLELAQILNELIINKELRDNYAKNAFDSLVPYQKESILKKFEEVLFANENISN